MSASFKIGDRVVRNSATWQPNEFDSWGRGVGVGVVVEPPFALDPGEVDVRWPGGRCFESVGQLLLASPAGETESAQVGVSVSQDSQITERARPEKFVVRRTGRSKIAKRPHLPSIVGCAIGFCAAGSGVGSLLGLCIGGFIFPMPLPGQGTDLQHFQARYGGTHRGILIGMAIGLVWGVVYAVRTRRAHFEQQKRYEELGIPPEHRG